MLKINAISIGFIFFHQKRKVDFVPPYTALLLSFRHGFPFNTKMYRYQYFKDTYMASNIESWLKCNINTFLWKIPQLYDECLQLRTSPTRNNEFINLLLTNFLSRNY